MENENPRNGFAWNSDERKKESEREEELLILRWFGESVRCGYLYAHGEEGKRGRVDSFFFFQKEN